jgi:serine/threonine protein kinase
MSDRTVLALVPPAPAAPRERGELQAGQCIEQTRRYRLVAQIGEGGMGTIWRAVDEALERDVAIKFLKPDVPVAYRRRFRREAKIGAGFDHPNLVRVLDAGSRLRGACDEEWLAMDLLQGHDLGVLLEMQGRIGVPVLLDVFSQALAALSYVHARRLVHRDIKPYNIFVARGPDGFVVKLIDFGICRNLAAPEAADDHIVGDPRYMPPEQATLGAPVDARTDLYALGLSLVQAATGAHPFAASFDAPVYQLLRAHRAGLVGKPSEALPGGVARAFGRAFDDFVATACAPDPARRFADADAMLAALRELKP